MKPYQKAALRRRFYKELPCIGNTLIVCFFILFMFILATNQNQTVQVVSPHVKTTKLEPTATPTPITDEAYIKSLRYGHLLWQVYGHESTWGKYDGCKGRGFNGFGFGWDGSHYPCYSSVREVARMVSDWFVKYTKSLTFKQALCLYNTGTVMDDCEYAEYTLSL